MKKKKVNKKITKKKVIMPVKYEKAIVPKYEKR